MCSHTCFIVSMSVGGVCYSSCMHKCLCFICSLISKSNLGFVFCLFFFRFCLSSPKRTVYLLSDLGKAMVFIESHLRTAGQSNIYWKKVAFFIHKTHGRSKRFLPTAPDPIVFLETGTDTIENTRPTTGNQRSYRFHNVNVQRGNAALMSRGKAEKSAINFSQKKKPPTFSNSVLPFDHWNWNQKPKSVTLVHCVELQF